VVKPNYKLPSPDVYCFLHYITLEGEDKATDNSEKEKPIDTVESSAVESGNVIIFNVQASSELKKDSREKDDSENKQNTAEEKANNKDENSNTKGKETANENKRSNGNNDGAVVPDDGNNNAGNTDSAKNKHSVRRARFSSEITIQPKAYFQAGTETVVMMVCMAVWFYIVM
jgi:hypothetical protein